MQEDPLIGRQLGNYAIERVIGRGGMAVVYFGRDVRLNRPAAIKVIDARFRDQPNYSGRFLQEARMVAAWRHDHILQIYYADDVQFPDLGKLFFFAMEYIDGQNLAEVLADLVRAHGAVPPEDVLRYGRAVAEALDYAHRRGVIHRDVKPANILVSRDGRVVLSDFGLALEVQQGSIGEVFGSAHYIAPEQARRSSDAVPQSDLYALGVILYEMLTGVVPFDDPSPTSVALQHITLPPPRPREINPALSGEVEAVLLKALAKTPNERYASGADLMSALENALVRMHPSLPTHKRIPLPGAAAPATILAQPPAPPIRRLLAALTSSPKTMAFGLSAVALSVCALAALSVWAWRSSASNRAPVTPGPTALSQAEVTAPLPGPTSTEPALSPTTAPTLAPAETATVQPTPPPAGPPTAEPTLPPTAEPTLPPAEPTAAAPPPADPPAPQPTPSWTPKHPGGRKMVLSWNDSSFYLLQVTGYGDYIEPVVFERLNAEGVPTNRFSGKMWAEYHATTLRDSCMRLEVGGPNQPAELPPYLRPAPCEGHYLASRFPAIGDSAVFWTRLEGGNSGQFRVLWGRDELQRCEIDAGTCEVYLP